MSCFVFAYDITTSDEDFDLTFGVDVKAAFLLSQAAARRMKDSGGGAIVNITSVDEHIPRPNFVLSGRRGATRRRRATRRH